jgi:MarR family transcriptional regulator, organic hydroperoxide resistance regulator
MAQNKDALLVQLDQQLCFKLYAASRLMVRAYRPLLDRLGVTYPQYLVLMVLWERARPLTIGELGDKLMLDSGTLTPLLKRMQTQGLVDRNRGDADERQVWVSATEAARALQKTAIAWVKASGDQLRQRDIDGALLRDQLMKVLDALKGDG